MKLFLCSKLKKKYLQDKIAFSKKDKLLVIPVCTMENYVWDEETWKLYFGSNGIQANKIVHELELLGANSQPIDFLNYYSDGNSRNINIYSCLILPGGNAELGLTRMHQVGIDLEIKNFKGNIIAYSAGALLLFENFFCHLIGIIHI